MGYFAKCIVPKYSHSDDPKADFNISIPGNINYNSPDLFIVPASDFYKAYYEIKLEGVPFHKKCNGRIHEVWGPTETNEILFPNKWRTIANGKIIRHVPIVLYADDTSGNRSKRWNKHVSYYFTLAGLPPVLSNMQYNCHFITTSNQAGALELAEPIVAELNKDV
ncbi:hypothetical protein Pst134EB_016097 [Puccinia striiformis f. sp. tritici]|nr:hypothetical protein Pst134EB_016097 [Puccinia striiformis f. sp. tritici]